MTCYSTNTESESYEAADLARIALQAAIDAVDAYQARNGVCDAPFRVTLHVDNGNEADREVSGPRPMADYRLWRHDGIWPEGVASTDIVRVNYTDDPCGKMDEERAHSIDWSRVAWYRVVEDT